MTSQETETHCMGSHSSSKGSFKNPIFVLNELISMTVTIKSTIDNWRYGCGVFIDLQKAVDTVNHSILLITNQNTMG